jgi:hypothetical protein
MRAPESLSGRRGQFVVSFATTCQLGVKCSIIVIVVSRDSLLMFANEHWPRSSSSAGGAGRWRGGAVSISPQIGRNKLSTNQPGQAHFSSSTFIRPGGGRRQFARPVDDNDSMAAAAGARFVSWQFVATAGSFNHQRAPAGLVAFSIKRGHCGAAASRATTGRPAQAGCQRAAGLAAGLPLA